MKEIEELRLKESAAVEEQKKLSRSVRSPIIILLHAIFPPDGIMSVMKGWECFTLKCNNPNVRDDITSFPGMSGLQS